MMTAGAGVHPLPPIGFKLGFVWPQLGRVCGSPGGVARGAGLAVWFAGLPSRVLDRRIWMRKSLNKVFRS